MISIVLYSTAIFILSCWFLGKCCWLSYWALNRFFKAHRRKQGT